MTSFESRQLDDPDVQRILREYQDDRAATFPTSQGEYTKSVANPADFAGDRGVFLMVVEGGRAVACGGVRLIDEGPSGPRAEVKHVFTRPEARGRGIARELMNELEARAQRLGAGEAVLDTNDSLIAARKMYQARGYEPIPPYNDNPNANVWLGKLLATEL